MEISLCALTYHDFFLICQNSMTLLGEEVCYLTLCSGGSIMAWHAQCGVIWLSAPDTGRVNIFLERRLQCQLEATHHISFPIIELKITSKGNQYNMSRLQMKSHHHHHHHRQRRRYQGYSENDDCHSRGCGHIVDNAKSWRPLLAATKVSSS